MKVKRCSGKATTVVVTRAADDEQEVDMGYETETEGEGDGRGNGSVKAKRKRGADRVSRHAPLVKPRKGKEEEDKNRIAENLVTSAQQEEARPKSNNDLRSLTILKVVRALLTVKNGGELEERVVQKLESDPRLHGIVVGGPDGTIVCSKGPEGTEGCLLAEQTTKATMFSPSSGSSQALLRQVLYVWSASGRRGGAAGRVTCIDHRVHDERSVCGSL